ncbi:MAG: sulfatase-like hydrolase/transferase [Acidaminococcaceae bacterium]|nr:sulfatase-like hydrolase/transferase [Acidaminococcaceae bacterium]
MKKSLVIGLTLIICFGLEYARAWQFLQGVVPFPENECWVNAINGFLRDTCILGIILMLYFNRKRIPDRIQRYFPVVIVGFLYLVEGFFIIGYLELDVGFLTMLSLFAGVFNNVAIILLVAMCYHHWPNTGMKTIYFLVYIFTCLVIVFDGLYFWTTSMHVESVFFKNLNVYAFQGIVATIVWWKLAILAGLVLVLILLFRVRSQKKRKPNFTWSLLCLIVFGLALNLSYLLSTSAVYLAIDKVAGLDLEADLEKPRQEIRNMVAMPIGVNFLHKAFFDTDKVVKNPLQYKERVLTEKDKKVLMELGVLPAPIHKLPNVAKYDRVVMLVLESVHRDYAHFYNKKIPAEATPFLDSLLEQYPHLSNYYSSSLPTTQGLNSTFRSQLIYDGDLSGTKQSSIYRVAEANGWKGIFLNASSRYYDNEYREYPQQFGMNEYYAKEDLAAQGYTGASGWGFHNDVMYDETLRLLEANRDKKLFLAVKTLDMHQPYPYYGIAYDNMPPTVRDNGYITICGMYWVDNTLKRFFQEANARGLMDDKTLFVITSDHNPHSGGEYKEIVQNEKDKQSIAPILMIFVSKNLVPLDNIMTNDYASQEDLAPTLLNLMGLATPSEFMGRNLLEPCVKPYALGYFGGKAYYFSSSLDFVSTLDEAVPDMPEKDAIANYIMQKYIHRHITNS